MPAFIASADIVDWAINEIEEIDCKTRKQLATTGKFQSSGDVGRLCIQG